MHGDHVLHVLRSCQAKRSEYDTNSRALHAHLYGSALYTSCEDKVAVLGKLLKDSAGGTMKDGQKLSPQLLEEFVRRDSVSISAMNSPAHPDKLMGPVSSDPRVAQAAFATIPT